MTNIEFQTGGVVLLQLVETSLRSKRDFDLV